MPDIALTIVASFFTAWFASWHGATSAHRHTSDAWWRLAIYEAVLEEADACSTLLRQHYHATSEVQPQELRARLEPHMIGFSAMYLRLQILGPRPVFDAAVDLHDAHLALAEHQLRAPRTAERRWPELPLAHEVESRGTALLKMIQDTLHSTRRK